MASIVYLDVDDEITSAAARIRDGEASVALVVPSGSRLATSRMNFRLLAREADARDRRLAIIAGDGATRALAASAGLPVFGSVGEYEGGSDPMVADGSDGRPDIDPTKAMALPVVAPTPIPASERPVPKPLAARSIPAIGTAARRLPAMPDLAGIPPRAILAAAVLGLAVIAVGVVVWALLPYASIHVTAREEPIRPIDLTVVADPSASAVDIERGVVPARRLSFDLSATDTFAATDRRIAETPASGAVVFRSYDTGSPNTIPRGSVVATDGGVQFRTRRAITLARAKIVPGRPGAPSIVPSSASVAVDAVQDGPAGNVAARTITVVPRGEDSTVTTVSNPEPTTGGTHQEFPRIGQADVDAAIDRLTRQLGTDFDAILGDPSRTPNGVTLFLESKAIADPTPSVDPASLVGDEVESFDMTLTSTGAVTGVDTRPLETIAEARVAAAVVPEHFLASDSVNVEIGAGSVEGDLVRFPVTATASQVWVLDPTRLKDVAKGLSVEDARTRLGDFGDVEIRVWPEWVTTVPTYDIRFDLTVGPPPP